MYAWKTSKPIRTSVSKTIRTREHRLITPRRCGISKFVRKTVLLDGNLEPLEKWEAGMDIPKTNWRENGVAGGWDCVMNSNCDHLEGGEERGW